MLTSQDKLNQALVYWYTLLRGWSLDGSLATTAEHVLNLDGENAVEGADELLQSYTSQWSLGDFGSLPPIVLLSNEDISGALGAYAASTDTIYLNEDWLLTATEEEIVTVLTEELGHHLDAQLNAIDTPGDEGELFAQFLARNGGLGNEQIQAWAEEDDQGVVVVNGEQVAVEQADEVLTSATKPNLVTVKFSYGGSYDGGYQEIQPVELSAGIQTWRADEIIQGFNSSTSRQGFTEYWYLAYARELAKEIVYSGGNAYISTIDPSVLIIELPEDVDASDVSVKFDLTVGGDGANSIFNGINPYAYGAAEINDETTLYEGEHGEIINTLSPFDIPERVEVAKSKDLGLELDIQGDLDNAYDAEFFITEVSSGETFEIYVSSTYQSSRYQEDWGIARAVFGYDYVFWRELEQGQGPYSSGFTYIFYQVRTDQFVRSDGSIGATSGTLNTDVLTFEENLAYEEACLYDFDKNGVIGKDDGFGAAGVIKADQFLQEGVVLTAPEVIDDPDGDAIWTIAGANPEYQWMKDGIRIDGATGSTYTVPADAIGAAIPSADYTVQIIYTDLGGFRNTENPVTAAQVTIAKVDNGQGTTEAISSQDVAPFEEGVTLVAGGVIDDPEGVQSIDGYKWFKDEVELTGETSSTLTTGPLDAGIYRVEITYTDTQNYTTTVSSAYQSVIAPPPVIGAANGDAEKMVIFGDLVNDPNVQSYTVVEETKGKKSDRQSLTTFSPVSIDPQGPLDALVVNGDNQDNYITAQSFSYTDSDGITSSTGGFDASSGALVINGMGGSDTIFSATAGVTWMIGGGVSQSNGIDTLTGNSLTQEVYDLRKEDETNPGTWKDAYSMGHAVINGFDAADFIVLSGTNYNVINKTITTEVTKGKGKGGKTRTETSTHFEIYDTSGVEPDLIAMVYGPDFTQDSSIDQYLITGQTTDPFKVVLPGNEGGTII